MKLYKILIPLLIFCNNLISQTRVGIQDYPTVVAVRNEQLVSKASDKIFVRALNTLFYWEATSLASDDGISVIKQNTITTGRFLKVGIGTVSGGWGLTGNVSTVAGTNFVGTTDVIRFDTRTANAIRSSYSATGEFSLGTIGIKVGGSSYASAKQNIEYSDNTAVGSTAVDGLAIYNGINGTNVTTRMTLWNTNVTNAFLQYNNSAYTGLGGSASFVLGTSLASNGATVFASNGVERMRIIPTGNVGVNTLTPTSTFQVSGSVATAVTSTSLVNYTATATDATIFLLLNATQTLTLPTPSTCVGRIYNISNPSAISKTTSVYTNTYGLIVGVVPPFSLITLQSEGTNWRMIGGNITNAEIGEIRGFVTALDHNGWVRMRGQLLTTLTPSQQANATALGFVTTLTSAVDRKIIGAGTRAVLSVGGSSTQILSLANLPNISLTGGNHGHTINDSGHSHVTNINNSTFNGSANGGERFLNNGGLTLNGNITSGFGSTANTTGISINASGNLSIPLGGLATAFSVQDSDIAFNIFIFLGF